MEFLRISDSKPVYLCNHSKISSGYLILGDTSSILTFYFSMVFFLFQDAAVQPTLVIVYFGGNDSMGPHSSGLGPHVPLPEYIENMRKIATHLKVAYFTTGVSFFFVFEPHFLFLSGNT